MMKPLKFLLWLEGFDENEPVPADISTNLNMTRKLPLGVPRNKLNRKFHLNTIIGRLYSHWQPMENKRTGKQMISPQWSLVDKDGMFPDNPYRDKDGSPTKKYYAAYKMWNDYVKNAISVIPASSAIDAITGEEDDFLKPARTYLKIGGTIQPTNIIKAMKTAAGIEKAVFGSIQARDYANFFDLLSDIFQDSDYEEAARDFYEIDSGRRELPSENIEKWLDDNPNAKVIDGPDL